MYLSVYVCTQTLLPLIRITRRSVDFLFLFYVLYLENLIFMSVHMRNLYSYRTYKVNRSSVVDP